MYELFDLVADWRKRWNDIMAFHFRLSASRRMCVKLNPRTPRSVSAEADTRGFDFARKIKEPTLKVGSFILAEGVG